jgi:hypothetical protein
MTFDVVVSDIVVLNSSKASDANRDVGEHRDRAGDQFVCEARNQIQHSCALCRDARIRKSKQDHDPAWRTILREEEAEVYVLRDDDPIVITRAAIDLRIRCIAQADVANMNGVVPEVSQSFCESPRHRVVHEEAHASLRDGDQPVFSEVGRVLKCLGDVFALEIGIVSKDIVRAHPAGEAS